MKNKIKRIPIARCPVPDCGRTLMYSGDPKDKHTVMLSIASDGYQGKTMMCPKCKTVLKFLKSQKLRQDISLCQSSAVSNADKL